MGFLDNLLKKEARKIISGVVDSVVDTVADSAREAFNQAGFDSPSEKTNKGGGGAGREFSIGEDEEDCCREAAVVEARIRKILSEEFSDCELQKNVAAASIGAGYLDWSYTYAVVRAGQMVAMINILGNPNDYKRKVVLQSKQACADMGLGYVHFLLHLPNRSSYIKQQLTKIL